MTPAIAVALLAAAGDEFAAGVAARDDAGTARPHFAAAARMYDEAWAGGVQTAVVAQNRGRSHALAGQTPQAIVAFHAGLAVASWDRGLRNDLAACRATVPYPDGLRPDPPGGVRTRLSPTDHLGLSIVAVGIVAIGVVLRATARPAFTGPMIGIGGIGVCLVVGLGIQIERERAGEQPLAVVARDAVTLRTGNGFAFPARLEQPLAAGVECRPIGRRGGWVHVELGEKFVGWLSESDVLILDRPTRPSAAGRSGIRGASGGAGGSTGS